MAQMRLTKTVCRGECSILGCKNVARAYLGTTGYWICNHHTLEDTIKQHKEQQRLSQKRIQEGVKLHKEIERELA